MQPLIALREFRFRTNVLGLLHSPMHLDTVTVRGMTLNVPPKEDRSQVAEMGSRQNGKIKIIVDHFVCQDTHLIINTLKPGKLPLDFAIGHLVMKDFGPGQPLRFQATLVNPKPVGNIDSEGTFGPFREDQPGDTPVAGNYIFHSSRSRNAEGNQRDSVVKRQLPAALWKESKSTAPRTRPIFASLRAAIRSRCTPTFTPSSMAWMAILIFSR